MRCIWSTTASHAFRVFRPRTAALCAGFSRAASRPIPRLKFPTTTRVLVTSAALSYSHPSNSTSVEDAIDAASESSASLPNLERPSRISFAAAQAIRVCIRNGGLADGFFRPKFEAAALQFGPDVSQRLSAHALLHGLLAKLMMAEGVALRSVTMQAVLEALVSTDAPRRRRTRFALQLMFLARRHRRRRTETMFKLFLAGLPITWGTHYFFATRGNLSGQSKTNSIRRNLIASEHHVQVGGRRAYILPPRSFRSHTFAPQQTTLHSTPENTRWKPILPDIVTANILIRSGTLIRRYDIVNELLEKYNLTYILHIPPQPIPLSTEPLPDSQIPLPSVLALQDRSEIAVDATRPSRRMGRIGRERMEIPLLRSPKADVHTLTSYIAYLTARGRPREVKRLLFALFPELDTTKYPTNSERPEDRSLGRKGLLTTYRRAISFGPVFLTAVLNALHKSRQLALADRVWQLAKKAERHSWQRMLLPDCKPWILEPHAYTIMLHCYGELAHRQDPWKVHLPPQRLNRRTASGSAWATFRYECQKLPLSLPPTQVRDVLNRVMGEAALGHAKDIPKPDVRFFNAALRAFRSRAPAMGKGWHRRQLRDAKFILEFKGVLPNAMIQAGYALPRGLRPLFVGRLGDHAPFAYRPQRFIRGSEKGLPISRAYPQLRVVIQRRKWKRWIRKRERPERRRSERRRSLESTRRRSERRRSLESTTESNTGMVISVSRIF
ncbi:hypothetical protein B0H14DRAFT_2679953 [Mycena olivaceomarginata]|nr:hypothetical protein B0H14DRAFT_2679953 [Mycena olivaceomarginata]